MSLDGDGGAAPGLWGSLLFEYRRDAVLAVGVTQGQIGFRARFVDMVRDARHAGELRPGNAEHMAEALIAATTGAAIQWLLMPIGDVFEQMEGCFAGTLASLLADDTSGANNSDVCIARL
jgi:hypothetical protein